MGAVKALTADGLFRGQTQDFFEFLHDLAEGRWHVDSYTLLADPEAMHLVPSFPLGLLTRDGYWGLKDPAEFALRTILMSVVLRVRSRSREARAFERSFTAWAQGLLRRWASGPKEMDD